MNAMTKAFVHAANYSANGGNAPALLHIATKQPKFKEGWSFNGSYKTFQALKAQGKIS